MMTTRSAAATRRRGLALIAAIVALAVLSITTTIIVRDLVVQRRLLERRHAQLQSAALARAGIEHAAARLLTSTETYDGDALELLPQASLLISAEREPGSAQIFRLSSVSRFPTDVPAPVMHTLFQRVRRVADGKDVRLEFLPPPPELGGTP
jgi:type II secretory pathway pseudopilin PulG